MVQKTARSLDEGVTLISHLRETRDAQRRWSRRCWLFGSVAVLVGLIGYSVSRCIYATHRIGWLVATIDAVATYVTAAGLGLVLFGSIAWFSCGICEVSRRVAGKKQKNGRGTPILTSAIAVLCILVAFFVATRARELIVQLRNAQELEERGAICEFSFLRGVTMVAFVDPKNPARLRELKALASFPNLRFLYLQYTEVSNRDLEGLRELSSLRHLVITSESIREDTVQELKAYLPHCTVTLSRPTGGILLTLP